MFDPISFLSMVHLSLHICKPERNYALALETLTIAALMISAVRLKRKNSGFQVSFGIGFPLPAWKN